MADPNWETLKTFLHQLLLITFPSNEDVSVVHTFLAQNSDKLNQTFALVLQEWAIATLAELDDRHKPDLARRLRGISQFINQFPGGDRTDHLEIVRIGYEIAAQVFTQADDPQDWAETNYYLGLIYLERNKGDRIRNLRQAIQRLEAALTFYTAAFPEQRAEIETHLECAYQEIRQHESIEPSHPRLSSTPASSPSVTPQISEAEIAAIQPPAFRAIAQSLLDAEKLTALEITPASQEKAEPLPQDLPKVLHYALNTIGINSLWSHQYASLQALRQGGDILLSTPTASGKTLAFLLPILETCLINPHATALFIFPLKALAVDQLRQIHDIIDLIPKFQRINVVMLTGDVPMAERIKLLEQSPQIICITPDLLHHQLFKVFKPQWQSWQGFLRNLRYLVIDEAHTYRGSFGAHFANLMRRLRLAIDQSGGDSTQLQHIFATATIGNPGELAETFSGREGNLYLIENSGAATAARTTLCLAPSKYANIESCAIVLAWLDQGLKGIVFCNSRVALKSLLNQIQEHLEQRGQGYLKSQVRIFYGSLKSDHRRQIIQQLSAGEISIILATSALEAGIDIPELDCCLLRGYPGSLMQLRQRQGRAGRKSPGLVIFLPIAQNALDYFYGNNPDLLLRGEVESAVCNPDYQVFLKQHLLCGACESGIPLEKFYQYFGQSAADIAIQLMNQHQLSLSRHQQLWTKPYPHKDVQMRGTNHFTVTLVDQQTGEEFEELDEKHAQREVFPEAIYQHQSPWGDRVWYSCQSLDLEKQQAILKPLAEDPQQLTRAEQETEIELKSYLAEPKILPTRIPEGRIRLILGWGEITDYVNGYTLYSLEYDKTCQNFQCRRYHTPVKETQCPDCRRRTRFAEIQKRIKTVNFEQPYLTRLEAPVLQIEVNQPIQDYLTQQVKQVKEKLIQQYGKKIPSEYTCLWFCPPEQIALHSITHQINLAVPLLILSETQEVNSLIVNKPNRQHTLPTIGYWFDTTPGGNGVSEAIFHRFWDFAFKAKVLAEGCDCDQGCPRCLMQHSCPESNAALNKSLGLSLLEIISQMETLPLTSES
ncbi:MAG: DEAD/DEAH box helicase [Coleofasciculus sp.]|uniref:DEAD/DEAH box helicase n=1 Tax=Coleofasciculus sp. TaxID=3100458 RepID=UPI003A292FD2